MKHKLILLVIYTTSVCTSMSIMWLLWTGIFYLMEKFT